MNNTEQNRYVSESILSEIKRRSSRDPISSSDLEMMFSVSGVVVRKIISIEGRREKKMLIVSGPTGYYCARDYNEYKNAMHHYLARAASIMKTEQIIREHYMPHDKQQTIF